MFCVSDEQFKKLEKVLYEDIGKKIKRMAIITFLCEMLVAIITGFVFLLEEFFAGLCIMVGGSLAAWVFSWFLYGFGELVDKVCDIKKKVCEENL